jgi:hypothetical protein
MKDTPTEPVSAAELTFLLRAAVPARLTAQQRADGAARLLTYLLSSIAILVWAVALQIAVNRVAF